VEPLVITEPSVVVYVIRRFMREMKQALGVSVAWTTHTQFVLSSEDEEFLLVQPPEDPAIPGAIVPVVGLVGPTVQRNQVDYTAHPPNVPTTFVNSDNEKVSGFELRRPSQIVDMSFEVNIFHSRKAALWNLAELFRQYIARFPYIVVPADRADVAGTSISNHKAFIDNYWSSNGTDRSKEGTVISQYIPHEQPILVSTARSNSDNLYMTESAVLLQNISLPDEHICAIREPVQQIEIDYYDLEDPCELVQVSSVDTADDLEGVQS